ncbi:hypothetical protein BDF22DRAFT_672861 [Syncephalis plumigaleata]|nr:hypothetical protein BDF22DRAFT_672861 [Syncephalis plumigaleata]
MRSFSLIAAGVLAYVATANLISPAESTACAAILPVCNCSGNAQCYRIEDPCGYTHCEPKSLNPQCANPKCESECGDEHICIYSKKNRNEQGCGEPICHLSANNQV